MPAGKTRTSSWTRRLWAELTRDKKKVFLLVVLGLVALAMGIHLAFHGSAPRRARAAAQAVVTPIRPGNDGENRWGGDKRRADWLAELRASQAKITRDIFEPNSHFFPVTEPKAPPKKKTTRVVTSQPSAPDREAVVAQVRGEAVLLQLQTTIAGSQPVAIINRQVVRKGDFIANFVVVEITDRSCVLRQKGVDVTLEMHR